MTETDNTTTEIASTFVSGTDLIPHPVDGAVPLYDNHPPDTHLPMWRCPHCGESGVTMHDIWKLFKRRRRLLDEREAYDYPSEEWKTFQDGIRETNREIDRFLGALPAEVSGWVRPHVDPSRWSESELNPEAES